jgi:uncharacterized protein YjgD (DUF1641 family)
MNKLTDQQSQIEEISSKLDTVLEYLQIQKRKSAVVDDLVSDLSLIGKDMYDTTVTELENRLVEIDPDQLRELILKLVKNIPTFIRMIDTIESLTDLAKDASPMVNEMVIDFTKKLHEFEQKGYFEFLRESARIIDNIVVNFSTDDIGQLADNIVTILQTIKNLTQPEVLRGINNAVKVFNSMEMEKIPEYSYWRLLREMGSSEMKRGMAFMVIFMKNLAKAGK